MRYRLAVLTDGRPGLLDRTLESFETHVRPNPAEVLILDDSGDKDVYEELSALALERSSRFQRPWRLLPRHRRRRGFCESTAELWEAALDDGPEFVFWLEDDFEFRRAVPLEDLAYVLERQPQVAQMSLLRGPANPDEEKAGGHLNIVPERFSRRGSGAVAWIEHDAYWTTNPSLFRRVVHLFSRWPTGRECEGHFTAELLERRPHTTFGIWGTGEQWVEHVGVREGVGY